jgi:hypothetical protein
MKNKIMLTSRIVNVELGTIMNNSVITYQDSIDNIFKTQDNFAKQHKSQF